METCKTCKWWGEPTSGGMVKKTHRACLNDDKIGEEAREGDLDTLVYPYDEGAYLYAGPDFGCVHHEEQQ